MAKETHCLHKICRVNDSLRLIRHRLGAIDLTDVERKDQTPTERAAYCASISACFPKIEQDIKELLYAQLLWGAKESANWEQVIFGRGVMEGMALLLEKWSLANDEHLNQREESFDKTNPLAEV